MIRRTPTSVSQCVLACLLVTATVLPIHAQLVDGQNDRINAGTPGRALPAPPVAEPLLRLAILPDRTTGRAWGLPYLAMAVADLNRIGPDAVLSIGDMVQGYTRSVEQWKREAAEYRGFVDELDMPFYPLAGNHEVVSGTRDRHDGRFSQLYQDEFGPLYYSVSFEGATVIVLFSDDPSFAGDAYGIGQTQLGWLAEELKAAVDRDQPIFVLLHRPLWRSRTSHWAEEVHPLLVDARVSAVFAGHFHSMQRDLDVDGVQYHIVGTCGGMIDQPPTAGQLQHVTMLNIDADGRVRVYHQPVGVTLPDDFVVREDQDRVFRLKTHDDVVQFTQALQDPVHGPIDAAVTVELHNPIDIPVTFDVALVNASPAAHTWPRSFWLSRFEQDRFNSHVTDVETPFAISSPCESVTLEPDARTSFALHLRCDEQDVLRNPPEFHFIASFVDTKGRTVPVILRNRLPLERFVDATVGSPATWPLHAWEFSVYELEEPNPVSHITYTSSGLQIVIDVPDSVRSGFVQQRVDVQERCDDPTTDAVRIVLSQDDVVRDWFIEPFAELQAYAVGSAGAGRRAPGVELSLDETDADRWQLTVTLSNRALQAFSLRRPIKLNIGVGDNDETFHTQWRWLAPRSHPATLTCR